MTIETVRRNAFRALLPPADLPLAEWVEESVFIPSSASATPGRMRLWSYQRGILDAVDDPEIERITVSKGARVGFTALGNAIVASFVAVQPSPILYIQPTADDARDSSVEFESMMEASPSLRGLLSDEADEAGRSTMMARRFAGGSLKFLAAKAPRTLRRHSARAVFGDEIDAWEVSAEGSPIELATMRTLTFSNRKLIFGGTPIFDHGAVTTLYAQSDQRVFELPCPECGEFREIAWSDIRWPEGKPEEAAWCCPGCGCLIEERHKPLMVQKGRWRATSQGQRGHAGFRVNCLVSPHPNAAWGKLAAEFLIAKRAPETLQTFTNLILGEPWRTQGDEIDDATLRGRAEPFSLDALPPEVLLITVGVDCQDDRLEAVTLGHAKDGTVFTLDHRTFWGRIETDTPWAELDDHLKTRWQHPAGGTIGVDAAAVDEGSGGHVERVRAFCRPRFARRVVNVKGVPGFARPFMERSGSKFATLWLAGVDALKSALFARLDAGQGVRFSQALPPVFYEQLVSERRVVRYSRGVPQARFERIPGRRAEALDAFNYAMAARQIIGGSLDRREAEVSTPAALKKAPMVSRSKWLSAD